MALSWPTTDGRDLRSALTRDLLAAVIQIRVLEKLREELGATYSPESVSNASPAPDGFGHMLVATQAAPDKAELVIATIREIAAELRATAGERRPAAARAAADPRALPRAAAPERHLATAVALAQSRPDRLDRRRRRAEVLEAVTAADLQAAAREYLAAEPLVVQVMPGI